MNLQRRRLPGIGRNVLIFALLFALIFSAIAVADHIFAVWQISSGESDDLKTTVQDVTSNLLRHGSIDLNSYRQWDNSTSSSYLIVADTDQLIDAKGDISDLLRSAVPINSYLPQHATSFDTDLGERWIISNRRLAGGNVVAGISPADQYGLLNPFKLLDQELLTYRGNIEAAEHLNTKSLHNFMTGELVISSSGAILSNENSAPIRVSIEVPTKYLDGTEQVVDLGDGHYHILASQVSDKRMSLRIIAFDNFSDEAIDQSLRFNFWVAVISWLLAICCYTVFAVARRIRNSAIESMLEISTRQLIAQGENAPVEFKSTMRWNLHSGKEDFAMKLAVLKTIAAFLNTDGGTLLIGVSDDKTIIGLGPDNFQNVDQALVFLSNLIRDRIGSAYSDRIKMRFEELDSRLQIIRVDCKPSLSPAYVKTEKGQAFYVRSGPSTQELPLNEVHTYIATHFDGIK